MVEHRSVRGVKSRRAALIGALGALIAVAGCSKQDITNNPAARFGWPEGITPEAQSTGEFWVWLFLAAMVLGVIMWSAMFWPMIFHRKSRAANRDVEFPRQTQYNLPLELILTVIPVVIVSLIFVFSTRAENRALAHGEDIGVRVDVTGYQWNWKFGYGYVDGALTGEMQPESYTVARKTQDASGQLIVDPVSGWAEVEQEPAAFVPGQEYVGTDGRRQAMVLRDEVNLSEIGLEQPHGDEGKAVNGPVHGRIADDLSYLRFNRIENEGTSSEVPILVLPVSTRIEFDLASADVTHAFWVPQMLFKRDVYKNPEGNKVERTFQTAGFLKEGAFVGRCAEMCGTYHAMMNFEVRVVSKEAFATYLAERQKGLSVREGLQAIGEPGLATTTKPFKPGRDQTRNLENILGN